MAKPKGLMTDGWAFSKCDLICFVLCCAVTVCPSAVSRFCPYFFSFRIIGVFSSVVVPVQALPFQMHSLSLVPPPICNFRCRFAEDVCRRTLSKRVNIMDLFSYVRRVWGVSE